MKITTEKEYEDAVKELEPIFHAHPKSNKGKRAEELSKAIVAYEEKNYSLD